MKSNFNLHSAMRQAAGIADDPDLVMKLLHGVRSKMRSVEDGKKLAADVMDKIRLFVRMILAYVKGDYKEIPWKSFVLIIGALLYFMMPLDMIPDFIPATGFVDDIAVILLVFKAISDDIDAFRRFESGEEEQEAEVQEAIEVEDETK